jgi:hypothetical protein
MIKEIKAVTAQLEKQAESTKTTGAKSKVVMKLKKMDAAQAESFFVNLADYWKIIRLVLKLVKVFTGPKADAKIDEVMAWGDENL